MPLIRPTKIHPPKRIPQVQLDGSINYIELLHYQYKNKNISIKDIESLATKLRDNIINAGHSARIQLVLNTPFGHRSGRFVDVGERAIHIWNPHDFVYSATEDGEELKTQEWYDNGNAIPQSFWFNVIKTERAGGCDNGFNDCFYDCLVKVLGKKISTLWDNPYKLKEYLKIKERDGLVNTNEHMDKIEKKINVQLLIEGDITRVPKINSKTALNLILSNAHYTVAPSSVKDRVKSVAYKEQKPITYHYDYTTYSCTLYNGQKEYTEDLLKVKEKMKNRISSKYVILKVRDKNKLKDEYDTFVHQADKMKVLTKGLINMYKSGSYKNTALYLFQHFTKHIAKADKIHGVEGQFIIDTYRGGLMKASPYEGVGYKYDVNAMYASILASNMNFPYKQGEFIKLSKEEMSKWKGERGLYFKYGIYRCVIEGDINPILFHVNKNNVYTHIDLALALVLGYTLTLIEDSKVNFLNYEGKTRISGRQLFKEYVDLLYPLKNNEEVKKVSKGILNVLWGALGEKQITKKYGTIGNDDIQLEHDDLIDHIQFMGENKEGHMKIKYETVKNDNMFVSGFARISPFLTAQARNIMAHLILDNLDDVSSVKRIHTDGFISSVPLKNTYPNKKEANMGQLGYEGKCENVIVINMRQPKGDFLL